MSENKFNNHNNAAEYLRELDLNFKYNKHNDDIKN